VRASPSRDVLVRFGFSVEERLMKLLTLSLLAAAVLLGAAASPARADVILVPADYTTIQEAIAAAVDGDTVLVAPATYVENIDFLGKAITVRSSGGPGVTILDGSDPANPLLASVVIFQSLEGNDSVLEGFTVTRGTGTKVGVTMVGGGICCLESSPTITSCVILMNEAAAGGGIYLDQSSSAAITNNEIAENTADKGGGIYTRSGAAMIADNTIRNNFAPVRGGGIHSQADGAMILRNLISENTSDHGGGIYVLQSQTTEIRANHIVGNIADHLLGGNGFGGGIATDTGASPKIVRNKIEENEAREGGGLHLRSGPSVERNLIRGNIASQAGGIQAVDSPHILSNVITDNTGTYGALLMFGASTVVNNTIVANHSIGITSTQSSGTVRNTIVWGNDSQSIYVVGGSATFEYCDIEGGWEGEGNIDADPMFVNAPAGDFHLRMGSPCVDAGTNDAPFLPATDYEGDDRILDGDHDGFAFVDIGADEEILHVAARFGAVNAATGALADVVFVNGSAGDEARVVRLGQTDPLAVSVALPPAGPDPAPFVLYGWRGEPGDDTMATHPKCLGCTCFPTPWAGGTPQPRVIWNNLGYPAYLGNATHPSMPAPSTPLNRPGGVGRAMTMTFQGFITDNASIATKPASVTNAVVVIVE